MSPRTGSSGLIGRERQDETRKRDTTRRDETRQEHRNKSKTKKPPRQSGREWEQGKRTTRTNRDVVASVNVDIER